MSRVLIDIEEVALTCALTPLTTPFGEMAHGCALSEARVHLMSAVLLLDQILLDHTPLGHG